MEAAVVPVAPQVCKVGEGNFLNGANRREQRWCLLLLSGCCWKQVLWRLGRRLARGRGGLGPQGGLGLRRL